ncbi:Rrf2 family transcriptional regulator [Streptomyces cinereoruber]|uniref:Rrf2 family transcriptional regulator n=1 Tax=Streptomyces cinereoruber TaxID=67260 RepID=UPI00362E1953
MGAVVWCAVLWASAVAVTVRCVKQWHSGADQVWSSKWKASAGALAVTAFPVMATARAVPNGAQSFFEGLAGLLLVGSAGSIALHHITGAARGREHRVGSTARPILRPAGGLSRQAALGAGQGRCAVCDDWPTRRFPARRPASEITLLQIVEAVDGASSPYECREIRQQGQGALPAEECQSPCILAEKMLQAHEAWRHILAISTLAEIVDALPPSAPSRTRLRLTGTP